MVETSQGSNNSIQIINDKGFNKEEILENINNTLNVLRQFKVSIFKFHSNK